MISRFSERETIAHSYQDVYESFTILMGDKRGLAWVVPWALTTEVPTSQSVKNDHAKTVVGVSFPQATCYKLHWRLRTATSVRKAQPVGKYKSINGPVTEIRSR